MEDAEFLADLLQQEETFGSASIEGQDHTVLAAFYMESLPRALGCDQAHLYISSGKQWLQLNFNPLTQTPVAIQPGNPLFSAIENEQPVMSQQTGWGARLCMPLISRVRRRVVGLIELVRKGNQQTFNKADLGQLEAGLDNLIRVVDNLLLSPTMLALDKPLPVAKTTEDDIQSVGIVAKSPVMQEIFDLAKSLSQVPVNVFISGENGTGKEVIARFIHSNSSVADRPFVAVNCAAIPESLAESEFFGYEKGAFTGAVGSRKGRFEEADGGTLFLDEIADLPPSIQPKFLRALQEQEGQRLGGSKTIHYNFRVISATNKDIRQEVEEGRFREDLFYRLFAVDIHIPPLRERAEEISVLADAFLQDITQRFERQVGGFSSEVIQLLRGYHWPGNVRQLRREIERLVALTPENKRIETAACSHELLASREGSGTPGHVVLDRPIRQDGESFPLRLGPSMGEQVEALEERLIELALQSTDGNRTHAAKKLGITRQWLLKKLRRFEQQRALKQESESES
uniref:Transcriptional regulator zraR n=1 Tax=Magnetococcus massalia (strain MO-1) TaxID=451514 RepID=A0A1S7LKC6_MAGMO|nr:transcriptional regulator zraR [Candidatus Magnetococcus massalia]